MYRICFYFFICGIHWFISTRIMREPAAQYCGTCCHSSPFALLLCVCFFYKHNISISFKFLLIAKIKTFKLPDRNLTFILWWKTDQHSIRRVNKRVCDTYGWHRIGIQHVKFATYSSRQRSQRNGSHPCVWVARARNVYECVFVEIDECVKIRGRKWITVACTRYFDQNV